MSHVLFDRSVRSSPHRSSTRHDHRGIVMIEPLDPRRLLSTMLAYAVSNNEMQSPDDPEEYVGTIMMDGVSVTTTTLSGSGMYANFIDAPFSPDTGSGFKWEFTGLPAHTMVRVATSFLDIASYSGSDVDEFVTKVGSNVYTIGLNESGASVLPQKSAE